MWWIILFCSLTTGFNGVGQQVQPGDRALAIRLFEEGKYADALPHFSGLCYNYPYDFLVKYYYGACLVESGNFGQEAEKNLVLASSAEVPVKVNFYLGKLYHGQGNWNSAQRYYNRYKNNAAPAEIAGLGVDELISLCYREINPFLPVSPAGTAGNSDTADKELPVVQPGAPVQLPDSAVQVEAPVVAALPDSLGTPSVPQVGQAYPSSGNEGKKDQMIIPDLPALKDSAATSGQPATLPPVLPEWIEFQINDKVTYLVEEMFHVPEAKNEFRMATGKETELDSLLAEVQQLRKLYHQSVKPSLRDSLATRIQNLEYRNMVLNTEVGQHYFKSRKLEQEWWSKSDFSQLEEHQTWRDSLLNLSKMSVLPVTVQDSIPQEKEIVDEITEEEKPADADKASPEENELSYRVQIGASDKGLPAQRRLQFEKLSKIRTIETMKLENGMTIYTTGNLKDYGDALKLQAQIRLEGIKDAFAIAVKNGKRIPLPKDEQ